MESRVMSRLDSIQSNFKLYMAQQNERDAVARIKVSERYQSIMDAFERMRGAGSLGPH